MPPELCDFIRLFNERRFFEAHEVLEGLWRREPGSDRDFYQGLIQIAAAFVHLQKNNRPGAERLLRTAGQYLRSYPPRHEGIDLEAVLSQSRQALEKPGPDAGFYLPTV